MTKLKVWIKREHDSEYTDIDIRVDEEKWGYLAPEIMEDIYEEIDKQIRVPYRFVGCEELDAKCA